MRVEIVHFLEVLIGSLLIFIEIRFLNKVVSFKGKSTFSIKKILGNKISMAFTPGNYLVSMFLFIFIATASSFLLTSEGKIQQTILLFSIADLVINQRATSLAHLANTLLLCVFIGLNGTAPISLLIVQLIFFILYAVNKGKNLKLLSVASQLVFFLSCFEKFNFTIESTLYTKLSLLIAFPFLDLFILHFMRSTPSLKQFKLDNIMWFLVMIGSIKGLI